MLVIKEAYYGIGSNVANVTSHLQSLVKDGSIDVIVGPKTMGKDPSVGSDKKLSVTYVADGVQDQKTIADGSQFAVYSTEEREAKKSAGAKVGEATFSLFKTILSAFSIFLHALGVGVAYKVGSTIFSSLTMYILVGLALLIPFFGLWGVPLVVFVYRLWSGQDFLASE